MPSGHQPDSRQRAWELLPHPGMYSASTRRCHGLIPVPILVVTLSILVDSSLAQTGYTTDGTPTALEEQIRWLMNRGRHDSSAENQTRGSAYADVPATTGPLAPHQSLTLASRHHSEDMARQNLFQHATVPGSAYYNAATQPQAWDRMSAEGYNWNRAAENIAAGYGSAESAYVGWWHSTGHRVNMFNAQLREVGNGYFYWAGSSYGRYYTMDLGSSGSTHFFTGTIFHDADRDGMYDQDEGVGQVRIVLRVNGTVQDAFDESTPVGSFAVPIQSIADGALVEVMLANEGPAALSLDIPRSYSSNAVLTLDVGEEVLIGNFTQPAAALNVGFRDLTPPIPSLDAPRLALARPGGPIQIRWLSQPDAEYIPQWSSDLVVWHDLTTAHLSGTGAELSYTDSPAITENTIRLYRVLVRRL